MYFRGKHPNFGDELNTWMWQKILPDFFDEDDKELFIGIGSTIGNYYDNSAKKIIFGAGFVPTYSEKPNVHSSDWDIYFVRGPRTAKALNISPDLAIGDAAILLRTVVDLSKKTPEVISFMPHWESLERGNWEEVCKIAGINLIDPRRPVEEVMSELFRSKLVICEAMHGAIVSDAFRIPWIPIIPMDKTHREKWYDWAEALSIDLKPHRLLPSSIFEAIIYWKKTRENSINNAAALSTKINDGNTNNISSAGRKFKNTIKLIINNGLFNKILIYSSAYQLKKLSKSLPCLSGDAVIKNVTEKMLEKVQLLKNNYSK